MGDSETSTGAPLAGVGLALALVAGFAFLPRLFAHPGGGGPLVGHDAPDFTLPIVANGPAPEASQATLSLRALRGQAILLDFWATWCAPCRAQSPILDRISRRWRDQGVMVLGVNTDAPNQGDPREFARAHGVSYPMVHDALGQASRSFEVDSLPTLVVISRTGKIIAVRTGLTEDAELERLIRPSA